ncbi:MAG: hypothetical protein ABEH35_02045 [Haloarculaceae archaeon]
MDGPADDTIDAGRGEQAPTANGTSLKYGIASAFLFGIGCLASESIGELVLDVDLKPFFLPYLLITLPRYGIPTLTTGLGAAIGEGALDVFEGYELDDPIGFLGYVIGFTAFGWYLSEVADDPTSARSLTVAAAFGAFVQALFEGFAFLVFEASSGPTAAVISVLGNTVTHGVVLGAVPLVALYSHVHERWPSATRT